MDRALIPADIDALLGVYALDAIDDVAERSAVEAWLARSPAARREVDELREAASMLAQTTFDPPAALWARIEMGLGGAPAPDLAVPPLRTPPVVGHRARRAAPGRVPRRRSWLVGIAAALAILVAAGVGVVLGREVSDQEARIDRLAAGVEDDGMEEAAFAAAVQPGARAAEMESSSGAVGAKVVATADGHGYLMVDHLPRLPAGRTYQLWALMGEEPGSAVVSVGVLGRAPAVVAFTTDPEVMGFAITEEAAPGATTRSQPMMLEGWLA